MTMNDPMANAQLELACRVGSREAIIEAIEEGADIDHNGSSVLIIAIMAGDRDTVSTLVELGADVSCFELQVTNHEAIVDALMKGTPKTDEILEEDPVDAKLVRAFDKLIRAKGLDEPFKKNRGGDYPAFRDGLRWIAAEECHAVVTGFLELIGPARSESGDLGVDAFLAENASRIEELTNKYTSAEEIPGDLLKDYLKERKKLLK